MLGGFSLLYWAGRQFEGLWERGPSFDAATLGWLGTLVAAGLVFGLAFLSAQRRTSRPIWGALAWALVPLALLVYFYLLITGVSIPDPPTQITEFLFSPGTQTTCALLVGLFASVALAPLVLPQRRRH